MDLQVRCFISFVGARTTTRFLVIIVLAVDSRILILLAGFKLGFRFFALEKGYFFACLNSGAYSRS